MFRLIPKSALFVNCLLIIILGLFHFNAVAAVCDADNNTVIDRTDIGLIMKGLGQAVDSTDPRDFDGNGKITIIDSRRCALQCKFPACAPAPPEDINAKPVANAGQNQTVPVNETITLNGSASTDADGDELSYLWSLVAPTGSSALLSDSEIVNPTLFIDVPGAYKLQLVVNDGKIDSLPDSIVIDTLNSAPIADAGVDQTTFVGATVTLDGSRSSDVDGDALSYAWALTPPIDSTAVLNDSFALSPTFIVDKSGSYKAELVVNDGSKDSMVDQVSIVTNNSPPIADAGIDQSAFVGDQVVLDGSSSSDIDSDSLTFNWSIITTPAGSKALLSGATLAKPTFELDVAGAYIIQLIVNDGKLDSVASTVTVTTENTVPQAKAGADQSVLRGETVSLDGSASNDVDGDELTFTWSLIGKPLASNAVLNNANSIQPEFTVDIKGSYVVQLIVNDGTQDSRADTVTITTGNSSPVAFAGLDQSVAIGTTVNLDGSGSSDADGDLLSFRWSFISRPDDSTASLNNPDSINSSFIADKNGTYIVQLIVNDGVVNSVPDSTVIAIEVSELLLTPSSIELLTNNKADISVALPAPAGVGGVALKLVSDDPSIASVLSSITIPEGLNSADFTITSGSISGAAEITVSGTGFAAAKVQVQVIQPRLNFLLGELVGAGRDLIGSIFLSEPAPAEGLTVSLSSNAKDIATVPQNISIAAGKTRGKFLVSGIILGNATLTATAPGFKSTTDIVHVTDSVVTIGTISKVVPGQSSSFTVRLSHAAPVGGITLFLDSSDPTIATVTDTVFVPEGLTSPVTNPKITGITEGRVHIVAGAPGYAPHSLQSANNDTPNLEDLSDPNVVYKRIKALPGITSNNTVDWLVGEWSSAYEINGIMIDEKFVFNADGSYQEIFYKYEVGKEFVSQGQWSVFTTKNSNWSYLLLKTDDGSFYHYPIERDGADAVRVISPRVAQMYANALLLVRLKPGLKTSVYPGRSILGIYEWDIFENDLVNISSKHYIHKLILEAPNKATYQVFLDSELQRKNEGIWTLTPTDLILNLGNEQVKYDIKVFNHRSLKLKVPENEDLNMTKIADTVGSYGTDLFVGEFQNGGGQIEAADRMSIAGLGGNQYRVDIHVTLADFKNLKATKKQDGLLYVDVPGKSDKVVLKPVFNGIQVVRGPTFDNFMLDYSNERALLGGITNKPGKKYFEKVSNKPLSDIASIGGWWRGYKTSVRLFEDGQYLIEKKRSGFVDRGTYTPHQGKTVLKSICGEAKQQAFPVEDNQLVFHTGGGLNSPLNPVPGMYELGETDAEIRYLLKRYADDSVKNQNAPLILHPAIANAKVVKQEIEWRSSIASENGAAIMSLTLRPDGTGVKHITGLQSGVLIDEVHLPNPDWHTNAETYSEAIKYYIVSRGDKEHIVFNETGDYSALVNGNFTKGSFVAKQERESLLFDGRFNACLKFNSGSSETLLSRQ